MKTLIVDSRITNKCEIALEKEGFSLLKAPSDPSLGEAVSSHPDTLFFYSDGEIITTADYCDSAAYIFTDIREMAPWVKISFTDDIRGASYPNDCILNALVIGKKIFCRSDTVSRTIIRYAEKNQYEILHTNQGYPACTVLAFGNSAITADRGIGQTLQKHGIKVTYISTGSISLPPHQYGFIGGASGVVGKKVYFFGNLYSHPDADIISKAITDEGYTPISLSDENLRDFGGIIAL